MARYCKNHKPYIWKGEMNFFEGGHVNKKIMMSVNFTLVKLR